MSNLPKHWFWIIIATVILCSVATSGIYESIAVRQASQGTVAKVQ